MVATLNGYWHLYSDGKRADIPFNDQEDKTFAMNAIAICAYRQKVQILCANVNDTHLHVIFKGYQQEVFARELKRRLMRYLQLAGKKQYAGEGLFFSCDPITDPTELKSKIIYTFRNCLDFFKKMPWEYDWGVGNLYFAKRGKALAGTRLGDLSGREQIRLLKTNFTLPQDWYLDEKGMILPACYVNVEEVERLFVTPRAFLAFLYVRKEDELKMKQQFSARYLEERTIQDMRKRGNSLSNSYCGKSLLRAPLSTRLQIARKMMKEGAGKSESLAKALFLQKEDLLRLL